MTEEELLLKIRHLYAKRYDITKEIESIHKQLDEMVYKREISKDLKIKVGDDID